jgi:hypothetical protein
MFNWFSISLLSEFLTESSEKQELSGAETLRGSQIQEKVKPDSNNKKTSSPVKIPMKDGDFRHPKLEKSWRQMKPGKRKDAWEEREAGNQREHEVRKFVPNIRTRDPCMDTNTPRTLQ